MRSIKTYLALAVSCVLLVTACGNDNDDDGGNKDGALSSSSDDNPPLSSSDGGLPSSSSGDSQLAITGFNVTDTPAGIALFGQIAAPEGATVAAIAVTANGNAVSLVNAPVLGVNNVALAGTFLAGVCAAQTGTISVNFAIAAAASDGTTATATKDSVSINCGSSEPELDLVKKTYTLSYAGTSYADLDAGQAYQQAAASSIKNKIDIIAYNGQGDVEDAIYPPYELDFFYNNDEGNYLGGDVLFFPIPSAAVTLLKNATKYSDLEFFIDEIWEVLSEEVYSVPVVNGTGFLVITTEDAVKAVIITGTGTQSVTLTVIDIPE